MPIHFDDLDIISKVAGMNSVLIVPCNMCPAVTVAIREKRPFIQFHKSFLKSPPFEEYLMLLQNRMKEEGVHSKIFRSNLYHQWFMCMWTAGRQMKLQKYARNYDAVVVLGCDSAGVTVRDSVQSTGCKVIEGMRVTGIMNAKLKFRLPGDICFEDCKTIPISQKENLKKMY